MVWDPKTDHTSIFTWAQQNHSDLPTWKEKIWFHPPPSLDIFPSPSWHEKCWQNLVEIMLIASIFWKNNIYNIFLFWPFVSCEYKQNGQNERHFRRVLQAGQGNGLNEPYEPRMPIYKAVLMDQGADWVFIEPMQPLARWYNMGITDTCIYIYTYIYIYIYIYICIILYVLQVLAL